MVKPGGTVHAVDNDWPSTLLEPVPLEQWRALLDAASHAFRNPMIGRQMYGFAKQAGFSTVEVRVVARPDLEGRDVNLVHNLAGYARMGGRLAEAEIQAVVDIAVKAKEEGTFLALKPLFMVTAIV